MRRHRGRVPDAHSLTYDMMLCRPDNGPSDKNPRFAAVAAGTTTTGGPPLERGRFVGDNILDFPESDAGSSEEGRDGARPRSASRYFMLPNPMYGSWQ